MMCLPIYKLTFAVTRKVGFTRLVNMKRLLTDLSWASMAVESILAVSNS